MSAVVADRMSGDRHNPNVELIAQGVANIASPMFGGLPATGAIARTATNIRSGAQTPVAGMIHAVDAARRAAVRGAARRRTSRCRCWPPFCSWSPTTWASGARFPALLKHDRADIAVWLVDVRADGVRGSDGRRRSRAWCSRRCCSSAAWRETTHGVTRDDGVRRRRAARTSCRTRTIPDYVAIFRIHGPFLFGATDKIGERDRRPAETAADRDLPPAQHDRDRRDRPPRARGRSPNALHASGRTLLFCGAREQPRAVMRQAGFAEHVGPENVCPHVEAALLRAEEVHRTRQK